MTLKQFKFFDIICYSVVTAGCLTSAAVSVTPLCSINHDIESTCPNKDEQCSQCGLFPHPIESIRNLPSEIQSAFMVPNQQSDGYPIGHKKEKSRLLHDIY